MRAKLAFRRNARQHIAERLTACDGLPCLHKHAGKPRIGADAFIRLPDFDAPAPKLVADTGEHHAVAHADGVVLSCVRDDLWGWHVAVRQTDGAICTYSGLSCALVQAGQSVVRGQPLGDVMAAVPAESELGAHLHLSLYRDGEATEPALPD